MLPVNINVILFDSYILLICCIINYYIVISSYFYCFEWHILCVSIFFNLSTKKIIFLLQSTFLEKILLSSFLICFPSSFPVSAHFLPLFFFKLTFLKHVFQGFLTTAVIHHGSKEAPRISCNFVKDAYVLWEKWRQLGPWEMLQSRQEPAVRQRDHCTWEASRCQQTAFVSPFMLINFCENLHVN